eukprot:1595857-Amphidinium_carterae.4
MAWLPLKCLDEHAPLPLDSDKDEQPLLSAAWSLRFSCQLGYLTYHDVLKSANICRTFYITDFSWKGSCTVVTVQTVDCSRVSLVPVSEKS